MTIVADASLIVEALVADGAQGDAARALLAREEVHAPHLIDVEVTSALRRLEARGLLDATRAEEAVEDLAAAPLLRYPHTALLDWAWQHRGCVSAYDGVYLALAAALDVPLSTADARLARSATPGVTIEVVGSSG
jgi:predicted nucleic acid-binding protein